MPITPAMRDRQARGQNPYACDSSSDSEDVRLGRGYDFYTSCHLGDGQLTGQTAGRGV